MNKDMSQSRRFATLGAALSAAFSMSAPAHAEAIVGLTSTNALVVFDNSSPMFSTTPVAITGLMGVNERILGIDLRPATGAVYGLGSGGNLYTLNATTGVASFVAALTAGSGGFAGLVGSSFGVDFNPVVDRLRVTSNAGQNLRINPITGAVIVDSALNGDTASLSASAYTSNTPGATATTLYGINGATDTLYIQNPPNTGILTAVGSLGVDTSNVAGFDISGLTGIGYAALTDGDTSKSSIYTINLASGAATLVGAFASGGVTASAAPLVDLTVAAVPEPETWALMTAGLLSISWMAKRRRVVG